MPLDAHAAQRELSTPPHAWFFLSFPCAKMGSVSKIKPLPILTYPNPLLKQESLPITEVDQELCDLLDAMTATMYASQGIGLAAPQVGVLRRAVVVDISGEGKGRLDMINPEILSKSGSTTSEEGCLSIPDYRDSVARAEKIEVQYLDRKGGKHSMLAEGLLAICIQHEVDHLDGVLFIDRLSRLKRDLFRRWFKKHGVPSSDERQDESA